MRWLLALLLLLPSLQQAQSAAEFEKKIFKALRENDIKVAPLLFLPELQAQPEFLQSLPGMWLRLQKALLRMDFEFYAQTAALPVKAQQWISFKGGSELQARVDTAGDESKIRLHISEKAYKQFMLSLILLRRGEQWYLQFIDIGLWKLAGSNADAWLGKASRARGKGFDLPALLYAQIGSGLLKPAEPLRYSKHAALKDLVKKIDDQAALKLRFPLNLLKSPGYPQVIRVEAEFEKTKMVPVVHAISRLDISNEKAHQISSLALAAELDSLWPGFKQEFGRVILRIYNEPPTDTQRQYRYLNVPVDYKN